MESTPSQGWSVVGRYYLVAPLPVCEITPLAALVACELFAIWVGAAVGCIGVAVPLLVVLTHAVSYCEAAPTLLPACALLYACPPVPPRGLLMPPSLNTEPGDVAALPGVPPPPASVAWQLLLWGFGLAYAGGAAPMTAMAATALTENNLCLMFTLRFRARTTAHPSGDTMSMGFWFKPVCAAGV
jgi:hypothetical protein